MSTSTGHVGAGRVVFATGRANHFAEAFSIPAKYSKVVLLMTLEADCLGLVLKRHHSEEEPLNLATHEAPAHYEILFKTAVPYRRSK